MGAGDLGASTTMDGDGLLSGGSSGPWGRFPAYLASSGGDVEEVHAGSTTAQAAPHSAKASKSEGEGYNVPTTSTSVGSRADSTSPPTSTSASVPSSQTTGVLPENVSHARART